MSQTIHRIELKDRVIILAGTVHISQESTAEVRALIEAEAKVEIETTAVVPE